VYKVTEQTIMGTYQPNEMKDGRIQLEKNYPNGVAIRNYPHEEYSKYEPHIYLPYNSLNEGHYKLLDSINGVKYKKTFRGLMIRFEDSYYVPTLQQSIQVMNNLSPIAQILNRIK